ncbi:MAG: DUF4893 domain-containing protein [Gemmatimonas sp.]|nr:DUF4893 domain-containing protein [Gemmatimonas sp.]
MRSAFAASLALSLLLTACATGPTPAPPSGGATASAWTAAIVPEDQDRLRRLPEAWSTALAQARDAGYGPELAALGALGDPGATLPDPEPPPGRYRCRTVKVGSQSALLPFVAYAWFDCEITRSAGGLRLDKVTGSQRQQGTLYPDTDHRLVFLGGLALGSDEAQAPSYGADRDRNVVGVMERFAPERWRLVQPWPRFESNLDLLEIEPLQGQRS